MSFKEIIHPRAFAFSLPRALGIDAFFAPSSSFWQFAYEAVMMTRISTNY